jgi:hypothetical protein
MVTPQKFKWLLQNGGSPSFEGQERVEGIALLTNGAVLHSMNITCAVRTTNREVYSIEIIRKGQRGEK